VVVVVVQGTVPPPYGVTTLGRNLDISIYQPADIESLVTVSARYFTFLCPYIYKFKPEDCSCHFICLS
jgi:hypothetical protein